MAPRKMKQVALEPNTEKNMKVRSQFKRLKAEMRKIKDDQERIREEQMKIRGKFREVAMQCDQLAEETKMTTKQTASMQIKVVLVFKILKAREDGDFSEAAALTHLLREIVDKERANASLDEEEKDEKHPQRGGKNAGRSVW